MAFGYGSFITNEFWITLYMQDVQHFAPLHIAARMLPQAVAGVFWSFLGQWLVQKIHGTIVMGIGSLMYLVGAVLLLFIKEDTSYWVFLFPALVITVVGADFQFIVANVSFLLIFYTFSRVSTLPSSNHPTLIALYLKKKHSSTRTNRCPLKPRLA